MTMTLYAHNEVVAVAFLKAITGLTCIATSLPAPDSSGAYSWSETGFVVIGTVGGTPDLYTTMNEPVVSVDVWAVASGSTRPPDNMASNLAMLVFSKLREWDTVNRLVELPGDYPNARVSSAYPMTFPRRVPSQEDPRSHYQFDMAIAWKEIRA